MELFRIGFIPVTLIDVLDVLVVTFIFWKLYQIMRGTRASQMFAGLLVLFVFAILSQVLNMSGTSWLVQSVVTVWVVAFVILFQPELRRFLMQLGQNRLVRVLFKTEGARTLDAVARAAAQLSSRRIGGLMVIQRDSNIQSIAESGVRIQGEVTPELLLSIFHPRTPLHDGAVIITGTTLEAARCLLPLSENPDLDPELGTRHRAALGVTEEYDCVTVVVSEETGAISLAHEGKFVARNLGEPELRDALNRLYERGKIGRKKKGKKRDTKRQKDASTEDLAASG
ncbi:diadenylate cyclase CdaA [bacterium]|nr:diadenylate cyclase CdaA [bacterium]